VFGSNCVSCTTSLTFTGAPVSNGEGNMSVKSCYLTEMYVMEYICVLFPGKVVSN
jgi:hypothetical protein